MQRPSQRLHVAFDMDDDRLRYAVGHDRAVNVAIWEKVAFNAAMNALSTGSMLPVGGLGSPSAQRLIDAVTTEVVQVAHSIGVPVDPASIARKIAHALAHHKGHRRSMLQDRLAGRVTQIETINGAVIRGGATAGVGTPVNRTLADMRPYAEESFGPVTAIIRPTDEDEAIRVANDTDYGLT